MSVNLSYQDNIQKPSRQSYSKDVAGAAICLGTAFGIIGAMGTNGIASKKLLNYSKYFTQEEIAEIKKGAQQVLETTGLQDKSVTITYYPEEYLKESEAKLKDVKKEFLQDLKKFKIVSAYKKFQKMIILDKKAVGNSGASTYRANIYGNGTLFSVFHELGHIMNGHFGILNKINPVWRYRKKARMLIIPIALYSLFKPTKKQTDNKKSKDFIKDNAGKLTFATFLPILIEEALASYKGGREAKKVLSHELYKKIAKGNKLAFITYLSSAVIASLSVYGMIKIKDALVNKNN